MIYVYIAETISFLSLVNNIIKKESYKCVLGVDCLWGNTF